MIYVKIKKCSIELVIKKTYRVWEAKLREFIGDLGAKASTKF